MTEGLVKRLKRLYVKVGQTHCQLFLTSFAILYFELALIRFIPAYVRYLGYFTNFLLLGSFLGIGVGCLMAKSKRNLAWLFPPLLLLLFLLIKFFKLEIEINSAAVVYFKSNTEDSLWQSTVLLPAVFVMVACLFTVLAQKLGRLMGKLPPLTAYTVDILGSIAGVMVFSLGSWLVWPATVWFSLFAFIYLLIYPMSRRGALVSGFTLLITIGLIGHMDSLPTYWSPYYKISPYSLTNPQRLPGQLDTHWRLYVNNISHQEMTRYEEASDFYKLLYQTFPKVHFDRVLIVGAGSGQDVNVALKNGVSGVDAVEIDPVIARLGKTLHPDHPYADKRVNLIINDARSYLQNTPKKYDLIIFALPDSAVLATSQTNLRLESYLFTVEAFRDVYKHLQPDGLFVLYNFYRTDWLVDKIGAMLDITYQQKPWVARYEDTLAVFMVGPKLGESRPPLPLTKWQAREKIAPATDDWPFLYLRGFSLPAIYIKAMAVVMILALVMVGMATAGRIASSLAGDFFFLGAAFLLLETKSIVNFNLLFGSTWLVNSLVIIGILVSVLAAIWVNKRFHIQRLTPWVCLLAASLTANYLVPLEHFLLPNFVLRYIVATVFFFSPIFLANVIFSNLFGRAKNAADNFGSNLLGAFVGGTLEYTSLLVGYHNLILIALAFYLLAYLCIRRRLRVT